MSDRHEDNQPIDPVIRAALRARQMPPSDACVDAETLAAWFEGGLDEPRLAAVDAHLADCARCQAMLAALAEAASVDAATPVISASTVVVPFKKPSRLRWIAPVAAGLAAASLIFWMVKPTGEQSAAPATRLAEQSAGQTAVGRQESAPPPSLATRAESTAPAPAKRARETDAFTEKPQPQPRPTPSPLPMPVAPVPTSQTDPKVTLTAPPPPPAVPRPAAAAAPTPTPTPTPVAAPPTTTAVTADQALARADRNQLKFEQQKKYPIEFGPPAPQAAGAAGAASGRGGGGGGGRATGSAATLRTLSQPPATIRWRILENGRVERTVNAGESWTAVPLEGPVFITSGTAASPSVCWLVGREGVVFRSTDGATFARIDFPEVVDLTSVTAQDANRATVSTRDGRVFTTTDGGHTWRSS